MGSGLWSLEPQSPEAKEASVRVRPAGHPRRRLRLSAAPESCRLDPEACNVIAYKACVSLHPFMFCLCVCVCLCACVSICSQQNRGGAKSIRNLKLATARKLNSERTRIKQNVNVKRSEL